MCGLGSVEVTIVTDGRSHSLVVDVITTMADGITTNWLMLLPCSSWNTNIFLTASVSFYFCG